ncbi:MAG: FprA family A-type flavoprotein [Chloroflexi bacterium]|nr:FprA family A-type flavoprotein [Chloroflexota bacterium]
MNIEKKAIPIVPEIYWVGVVDRQRQIFDAFFSLPHGTSYNSYLVIDGENAALIDTVAPGFGEELAQRVQSVVPWQRIRYLIMNHAEPDHGGSINKVLAKTPEAKLVTTVKGVEMASVFYEVPPERIVVVKDGDSLELGNKTLKFIEAPWLHWPETMFTFCPEAGILFPCDFFGSHLAWDKPFDDDAGGLLLSEAKRYYAAIMMPYSKPAGNALDKIRDLDIKVIAPSHGPIYKHPQFILDAYQYWVRGPLQRKAVLIYASMWGSTEIMAKTILETMTAEGVETMPYDLVSADMSYIARDIVDASAIVLGAPTFLGGSHPLMDSAMGVISHLRPRAKLAAVFGSYGWGGGSTARMKKELETRGFEVVGSLEVKGRPKKADLAESISLGQRVALQIKERIPEP